MQNDFNSIDSASHPVLQEVSVARYELLLSELLKIRNNIGEITLALGGGDSPVGVLFEFTSAQALVQHIQSNFSSA